jgi:hypothetical protein
MGCLMSDTTTERVPGPGTGSQKKCATTFKNSCALRHSIVISFYKYFHQQAHWLIFYRK